MDGGGAQKFGTKGITHEAKSIEDRMNKPCFIKKGTVC